MVRTLQSTAPLGPAARSLARGERRGWAVGHRYGDSLHLSEEAVGCLGQVEDVLHDLHAFAADDVPSFRLPGSLRVDQVSDRQLQGGAVGQQLVEVGLREAGWLLCLVLRVDDPAGDARCGPPDEVRL